MLTDLKIYDILYSELRKKNKTNKRREQKMKNIKEVERIEKYNGLLVNYVVRYMSGKERTFSDWKLPNTVKEFVNKANCILTDGHGNKTYTMFR